MSDTTVEDTDNTDEGSVQLIGTAHVSKDSVKRVEETIDEEQPDMVAVELDEGRYKRIKGDEPDDIDPADVIGGNTAYQFLAYWILTYVQARMGDKFDVEPGADMRAGIDKAEEYGIPVALVDRDIQVTVQRFWKRLGFGAKFELLGSLMAGSDNPRDIGISFGFGIAFAFTAVASILGGPYIIPTGYLPGFITSIIDFIALGGVTGGIIAGIVYIYLTIRSRGRENIDALDDIDSLDDIEHLTDTDVVSAMLEEFRRFSPGGAEALIDERDAYIANELIQLRKQGYDVIAVVGAGHREGIQSYLDKPETLPDITALSGKHTSRRFSPYKLFGYLFTLGFAAFFGLLVLAVYTGVEGASTQLLVQLFGAWFLLNAVFAFTLAKIAGAHWTSATVGGCVAWLTSVNPLLAPGWFAGYVELRYINVNVSDIAQLNEIIEQENLSVGQLWRELTDVPLFRLIAVVISTNLGSFVASMLFLTIVLPVVFSGAGIESIGDMGGLLLQAAQNGAELVGDFIRNVV